MGKSIRSKPFLGRSCVSTERETSRMEKDGDNNMEDVG